MALIFKKEKRKILSPKLLLLALVALIALIALPAFAQKELTLEERQLIVDRRITSQQIGRYQLGASSNLQIWVLDTITGQVRVCEPDYQFPPKCYSWSKDDRFENGK